MGESFPQAEGAVGSSRIGGVPDLPPTLGWPAPDGDAWSFVAQVDLGALTADWVDGLPTSGWLYFFVGEDLSATDPRHAVLHFDGPRDALRPTAHPSATRYAARAERLEPSVVLGESAREDDDDDDNDLRDQLDALGPSRTQLGGLAWADDLGEMAHLLRTGRAALIGRLALEPQHLDKQIVNVWADANVELAAELERVRDELLPAFREHESAEREAMQRWRVLFLVVSEEDDTPWSDVGALHFVIDDDDLRAGRFDRTYCCLLQG
jgi:hypothetical protein